VCRHGAPLSPLCAGGYCAWFNCAAISAKVSCCDMHLTCAGDLCSMAKQQQLSDHKQVFVSELCFQVVGSCVGTYCSCISARQDIDVALQWLPRNVVHNWSTQLPPVPCKTTKAAFDLRAGQMTDIQKQIREDCTRYRYESEAGNSSSRQLRCS